MIGGIRCFTGGEEVRVVRGRVKIPKQWRKIFDEEGRRTIYQFYDWRYSPHSIICYPLSSFSKKADRQSKDRDSKEWFFPKIDQECILSRYGWFTLHPKFREAHPNLEKIVLISGGNFFYVKTEGKD